MPQFAIAYVSALAVFVILDGGWLAIIGPRLYKPRIGALLAEKPRVIPAIVFYLLYAAGLVWFAILPSLSASWTNGLMNGALLGLIAYGTYDLTCAAVLKTWSIEITLLDMAWGSVASAAAGAAGVLATRHFGG